MKNTTLARAVKRKTKYDLRAYCQINNLSLSSLYKGYVSKRAKKILQRDGIKVDNYVDKQ
ncbi:MULTISPECIES: hypothetical protein [Campylobacter]|uniref:hypothetical protein n=1 Tax=Campylobacter TaxID=194 RepID=UPI0022B4E7C6|nr:MULTISPECIES: hypothetical protein [Campylobacter]MCI6641998.1 hypothetical protein [Campylobacter sp.]MCZ6175041.1 hypothetical protein [Campylobacter ureolyticus]